MHRKTVRVEQSRQELARLRHEFGAWHERRAQADAHDQYTTQFAALALAVTVSLERIEGELDGAGTGTTTREAHQRCRAVDRQVVFVRRLWSFFRDKWAQRDDAALGAALSAADDIVWSCYAPPFRRLRISTGPAPLTFFDDDYSPYAIARRDPPEDLTPSDALLDDILGELPIPVVGLPPICAARPWLLAVLAHEVGHHVAQSFPDACDAIAAAVADGVPGPAPEPWAGWAHELFADAYAVALIGGAQHWVLVELEQGDDATMTRVVDGYPPPIVRHALNAELLARLELAPGAALPPATPAAELDDLKLDRDLRTWIGDLLAAAPSVAATLLQTPLIGGLAIPDATRCDPALLERRGDVERWADRLVEQQGFPVDKTLATTRLVTAGAVLAWTRIAEEGDAGPRAARAEILHGQMLTAVAASREDAKRAARPRPPREAGVAAARLAARVIALPADERPPRPNSPPFQPSGS